MPPKPPHAPVTLKDISRAAGVHLSTVSLALRGSPKIAAETRDRVLMLAKRLGYHRDPISFALSARRMRASGTCKAPLIVFLTSRTGMDDFLRVPHMPCFLEGAQAQAEAMGFACELVLVNKALPPEEVEALLISKNAQGVILGAFLPQLPRVQLDWSRYAVVKIDSWFMPPAVARISYDQQQIVGLACERLHALGYRRIGMAVGKFDEDSSDELHRTGYLLAQHLLGLPVIAPLYFAYLESEETSGRRLAAWTRGNRLDAVISNFTSVEAMLKNSGIAVPEKVAWANLCLHFPDPMTAGVLMSHTTIGRKAVEMIALLIKTRQYGIPLEPPTLYVEGEWRNGASAPAK